MGLILGWEMIQLWSDLPILYGQDGIIDNRLLQLHQSDTGWNIYMAADYLRWIALAYLLCCAAMTLRYHGRLASILLLILHHGLWINDPNWSYGVDYLAQTGLLICCLSPKSPHTLKLLRWQLTVVYLFGGLGKAIGASWYDGEALWRAVQQPFPGALFPIPTKWGSYKEIWIVSGWFVILLELCYPLIWRAGWYRLTVLVGIIGLHVSIALTMGLYHFASLMIWYNLCSWYFPDKNTIISNYSPLEGEARYLASTIPSLPPSIQGKEAKVSVETTQTSPIGLMANRENPTTKHKITIYEQILQQNKSV